MADQTHLPELPLMLANVPRPVAALLRGTGLPVEELPRVPLSACGCGRFVLFDSQNRRSACQAGRAARQGLTPLDLREMSDGIDWLETANDFAVLPTDASSTFIERLKTELERHGGVWIRVGDAPHPFRSVICVGVEHSAAEHADFPAIVAGFPTCATHFVSSLLRGDELTPLTRAGAVELGWRILPEDCQSSRRGTLSHWKTRIERFRAVGRAPLGLSIRETGLALPAIGRLAEIGLQYAGHPEAVAGCRVDNAGSGPAAAMWTRFGMARLPSPDLRSRWVRRCYQVRCPLFLTATTDQSSSLREILAVAQDSGRCPLMSQTSFGEFARWWQLRRRLKLQVWRRGGGCEIHAVGDVAPAPWSIEISRGDHVATVPLSRLELHVPDDGLVYQKPPGPAAGCTIPTESQTVIDHPIPEESQRLAA